MLTASVEDVGPGVVDFLRGHRSWFLTTGSELLPPICCVREQKTCKQAAVRVRREITPRLDPLSSAGVDR